MSPRLLAECRRIERRTRTMRLARRGRDGRPIRPMALYAAMGKTARFLAR